MNKPKTVSIVLQLLVTLLLLQSCKSDSGQSTINTSVVAKAKTFQSDLGIQKEHVQMIVDNCSHVDVIFSDLPISMSLNDKAAIMNDLSYISPDALSEVPLNCGKPIGRKVFNGNGEILIEADIYFSQECVFFVFIKDEELLFANRMNDKGVNFYNNIIAEVTGAK